jgi:hypothetical protein
MSTVPSKPKESKATPTKEEIKAVMPNNSTPSHMPMRGLSRLMQARAQNGAGRSINNLMNAQARATRFRG